MLDLDKIGSKIQKLLALADGNGNEAESIAAWAKALELAVEYGLDLERLRQKGEAPAACMEQVVEKKPDYAWKLALYDVICRVNACKLLYGRQNVYILGEKHDVEIARGLYQRILKQMNYLCGLETKARGLPHKGPWATSYKTGMATRVEYRLWEANQKVVASSSTALVLARDSRTEEFALSLYGKTREASIKPKVNAPSSYGLGYRHGDRVQLHDSLKG